MEEEGGGGKNQCTLLSTKFFPFLDLFSRPHLLCFLCLMGSLGTESTDQASLENVLSVNSCVFSLPALSKPGGVLVLASILSFSLSSHLIPREYNSGLEQTPFYLGSF